MEEFHLVAEELAQSIEKEPIGMLFRSPVAIVLNSSVPQLFECRLPRQQCCMTLRRLPTLPRMKFHFSGWPNSDADVVGVDANFGVAVDVVAGGGVVVVVVDVDAAAAGAFAVDAGACEHFRSLRCASVEN